MRVFGWLEGDCGFFVSMIVAFSWRLVRVRQLLLEQGIVVVDGAPKGSAGARFLLRIPWLLLTLYLLILERGVVVDKE